MEAVAGAVVGALAKSVASKLFAAAEKMCKGKDNESKDLDAGIKDLQKELLMISAAMKDQQLSHTEQRPSVASVSMEELSDVAHEIEDCLDQFLPCAACGVGGETTTVQQSSRKEFRAEIKALREKLDGAYRRRQNNDVIIQVITSRAGARDRYPNANNHTRTTTTYEAAACSSPVAVAVGMEEPTPTEELGDLLVGGDGEASKLKVISVVGFGGSGKTTLAWAVYNCDRVKDRFPCRAWVVASEHQDDDAHGLLTAILKGLLPRDEAEAPQDFLGGFMAMLKGLLGVVGAQQPQAQDLQQLKQHIRLQLQTKRCLIVIDDIKVKLWGEIEHIFPAEKETHSRILVTTAVTSVARTCSFDGGYIYNMRSLSAKQSKDYLERKVFVNAFDWGSSAIVEKCAGNPLALVSVANDLKGYNLTANLCEDISEKLCSRIDRNENGHFTKLGQVLMNSYSGLPDNSHKKCLLYAASVFPGDRPFSTDSLVRRLSAEGYIEGTNEKSDLEVAYENLEKLIDRNIIQPIDARTNSKVKTCRTNGIMNQFMLHRSRSSGFIAYSRDKNRSNCRHLVIQNQNHRNGSTIIPYSATTTSGMLGKQLRPRSLTVYGSAGEADSDLTSCELLRVLDLKECADLKEKHLNNIYKLLHLKYLTLGTSVTKLSDKMEKLHCLETLDLRKTKIETLPEEVITLPHLAHLFGKIKLKKVSSRNRKNLNLQTLAGVVVDNQSGFPQLMGHMKKLTKVKIWCEITSKDRNNYTLLSDAIQKFAADGIDTPVGTRCLSLHIKHSSKDLLDAPSRKYGFLSSLKLHGRPTGFPQFVKSLTGLEELCLTSTNLKVDDLSEMSMIPRLLYLKLVQFDLEGVRINLGNFPKLERLCIVLQKPGFPTIQQGALPSPLVSLQLLCKGLEDHCNHIDVNNFVRLQEIALDSTVKNDTKQMWETKAKAHPKWPRVLFLESVGPAGKYVAVDRVSSKPSVQGMA